MVWKIYTVSGLGQPRCVLLEDFPEKEDAVKYLISRGAYQVDHPNLWYGRYNSGSRPFYWLEEKEDTVDRKGIDPTLYKAVINIVRPFAESRANIGTISETIEAQRTQEKVINAIKKQYGEEFARRVNEEMNEIRTSAFEAIGTKEK